MTGRDVIRNTIGPGQLRCLAAIMWLRQRTQRVTYRRLRSLLGLTSLNAVYSSVRRLERRGLILCKRGKGNTIRPAVRWEPADAERSLE